MTSPPPPGYPTAPPAPVRNVRELADQLGISVKEAMALCVVSGHTVKSPESPLTPEQAQRARDVLEGRAAMSVPASGGRGVSGRAIVTGLIVVVVLGIVVAVGSAVIGYVNEDVSIAVRPGQCFNDPGPLGKRLEAVPCDGDHDFRAEAVLDLNPVFGDEFPGWEAIKAHAENRCEALGTGAEVNDIFGTTVEFYYFGPQDAASWENPGARKIVCAERSS